MNQDKVAAFDSLFTNNDIQKLKIFSSCLDLPMQKHLAVYIKFLELQYTIDFFRQYPQASVSGQRQDGEENLTHLLDQILPFCSPDQQNQIRSVSSALKNMAQFQEMAEMMQMMKEMFPQDVSESFMGFSGENGPDPSMLSQIFQLFSQKGEE